MAKDRMNNNDQNNHSTHYNSDIISKSRKGFVRWIFGALLIVLLIGVLVVPLFFQWPTPGNYGYYPRPFFFFPFGFLIFFFFIFFGARWLFWGRGWGRGWGYGRGYWHNHGRWDDDATEILKQRYAKGEITKDQFDQMMRDLKAHDAA